MLRTPAVVGFVTAWRAVLQAQVVQIRHRAGGAAACRQPSCPPRQGPPSVKLIAGSFSDRAALHRPLGSPQPGQLHRQRPSAVLQIPQLVAAVERPPGAAASPAAPIASLRGCTDRRRRAWASRYTCGPYRTPSREGWRSPRAGGSSGRSRGVTALGLAARLRPTHQADGHGQVGAASRVHRTPPPAGPAQYGVSVAGDSKPQRPSHRSRGAPDRPVRSCPGRVALMRPATSSSRVRWRP
jgi:hypothetical protein